MPDHSAIWFSSILGAVKGSMMEVPLEPHEIAVASNVVVVQAQKILEPLGFLLASLCFFLAALFLQHHLEIHDSLCEAWKRPRRDSIGSEWLFSSLLCSRRVPTVPCAV